MEISIELQKELKSIVAQALLPEINGATVPRTQVNISETNVGIILTIEAENTNSVRAALNSYLRWLNCIVSTATVVNKDKKKNEVKRLKIYCF